MKYKERLDKMLVENPKALDAEIEEFSLLGEKDFRMNTVYLMEQRGADLVSALDIVEIITKEIKKILKTRRVK